MGIITISRGSCSKGKDIAEKLAQRLEYKCISREILLNASEQFNVPEIKLTHAIEDPPSFIDSINHGRIKYVAYIRQAFLEYIREDNVVYHGFAGQFFTKGIPGILKVRIVADPEYRVNVIADREGLTEDKARRFMNKVDSDRRKWSLSMYGMDSKQTDLYDITLKIHCMGIDDSVDVLYHLAKRASFQTREQTKVKLDDMLLSARIYSLIVNKFPVADVKCKNGEVLINVESSISEEKAAKRIEKLLRPVDGIKKLRTSVFAFDSV